MALSDTKFNLGSSQSGLGSSEQLYQLAQLQGGSVAQSASELVHPETSILSTMGNAFKNAFSGFVDVISTPSHIVAGILSENLTIKQAMEKNVTPSDVIFGKPDKHASIYQKVGSFVVRTATDILLDPTTYLTFGTGGVFGNIGRSSVVLGENAAKKLGVEAFEKGVLSKEGQATLNLIQKMGRQAAGDTSYQILKTGDEALDIAGGELKKLLKNSLDSKLDEGFATTVMSKVLEKNPALARTLIDKGGIKYFGTTLLSSQRINSAIRMIPGFTKLDHFTEQPRRAVMALFSNSYQKNAEGFWVRIPAGIRELGEKTTDLLAARQESRLRPLKDAVKAFGLNDTEAEFLRAAHENNYLPSSERLQGALKFIRGYSNDEWNTLVSAGLLSKETRIENHVPNMLVKPKLTSHSFTMPPSVKTGATKLRTGATFVDTVTGEKVTGFAEHLGLKPANEAGSVFVNSEGKQFTRETAALHDLTTEQLTDIEETLLKDPKAAQKVLEDARRDGFDIFDPNIFTAHAARTMKNMKAVTMKDFIKDLAGWGVPDGAGSEGFVKLSDLSIGKEGTAIMQALTKDGELTFHPAVASYIENFAKSVAGDDATMGFLKAFDKMQNIWKASVTSIFPAFHGRNAISNVLQNYLDLGLGAINPVTHANASTFILADRKLNSLATDIIKGVEGAAEKKAAIESKVLFKDASGYDWTVGELRQTAKNHNIAFTSNIVTSTDVQGGPAKIAERLFPDKTIKGKAKALINAPIDIGQDIVGRTVEEQGRLVNFMTNLMKTGDVTMSAQRTKQFLFDYGNLTNFERNFMKRIIPFYAFTRKNLELQARALLTTPGRIASEVHAITTLGEVISGGQQLSDEERDALPDWIKDGISILTKKRGDQINILANLGTPLEAPFQSLQANNLLGSVSPLIRVPVELGAGYSFFNGKPLSEVTNASAFKSAPKIIRDAIGFTKIDGKRSDGTPYTWYTALHPEVMHLFLNLPPTTRIFSTLKQVQTEDISTQAKTVQQLIGTKIYSFDLQRERDKREKELTNKLEALLTQAGVTAQFTRTYIPKAQKSKLSF